MIKLIATDMDGTFLDSSKQFDERFYIVFQKLKEKGIIFVIASGNQFLHLYNTFPSICDELYYIAENGAFISHGKKSFYSSTMEMSIVYDIMNIFKKYPQLMVVICGEKRAYIHRNYSLYKDEIEKHYDAYQFIDNIDEIDDGILKFSIHDPNYHVEQYVEDIQKDLPQGMKILTSGNEWMDIQYTHIHKGSGMIHLQNHLHFSRDECAAFGDQMNDYELLKNVKYAYAMDNAVETIKDIAYEVVHSNDEQGVILKIEELLENMSKE
jgi:HAD-superfamily hydrolase, subfamily IIB